jgi:hypothetical protein
MSCCLSVARRSNASIDGAAVIAEQARKPLSRNKWHEEVTRGLIGRGRFPTVDRTGEGREAIARRDHGDGTLAESAANKMCRAGRLRR